MKTLSLSLRPRSFADMVGQASVIKAIESQIASGRIPAAWMLQGQAGNGKTTLARIIALSFQGSLKDFGSPTPEMWALHEEGGYQIIEINGSSVNGIEELRKVAEESAYLPTPPSKKRVYILDEAQRISEAAQNLLLKPFEEPPPTTIWIICTTHPQKLLPTLRQRCFRLSMSPLGDNGMLRLMQRAAKSIKCTKPLEPLRDSLNEAGISSPRAILQAVEKYAGGATPQQSIFAGDVELDTLRICRAFVRGDWPLIRKELKNASPEDARMIRLSILGYLRTILLSDSPSIPPARIAGTLRELTSPSPFEDPAMLAWVSALLYQECKKYKES